MTASLEQGEYRRDGQRDAALPVHSDLKNTWRMLVGSSAVLFAAVGGWGVGAYGADVDFNRDVRPLLSAKCFTCHGPDESSREADLRLDLAEGAQQDLGGYAAIVPGQPEHSELIARVATADGDLRMPPEGQEPLSPDEVKVLERWIAAGAEYQPHWAFVSPTRPAVPDVGDDPWPRGAIDAFLLERMHAAGLEPAPRARQSTLFRRVYLDLIGLPPTPEELEQLERESAAGSFDETYQRLVGRLLDSPRYGEHWARPWLDLARYADTNGYEKDRDRSVWPYRDWVVQALNADMPFDQFTVEQIAGDMLPGSTLSQRIATGFHRNTMLNEEGGIDPLEFRFYAMTDRVATTGVAWLGLTLGCAQCHSHKYDPISHREYYELMAFLDNADEPEIDVPSADLQAEAAAQRAKADRLVEELLRQWPVQGPGDETRASQLADLRQRFEAWLAKQRSQTAGWTWLQPIDAKSNSPLLSIEEDATVFASGDTTKRDVYQVGYRSTGARAASFRLEALPDERLPGHGPGMTYYEGTKGDFFLGELRVTIGGQPVALQRAEHSYARNQYGGDKRPVAAELAIDGDPQTGWSVYERSGERHIAVFTAAEPVLLAGDVTLTMEFGRHFASSLGKFRLSASDLDVAAALDLPEEVERLLAKPAGRLTVAEHTRLWEEFLLSQPEFQEQRQRVKELRRGPTLPTALVMRERPPHNHRQTRMRRRGEYLQPEAEVIPSTPAVLHPYAAELPRNRLGFARWLAAAENPLTPRVVANRHWAALFGRGIVETVDDFGTEGALPSHPELLDWLAVELIDNGWSLKWLHRTLVESAAYQQSSQVTSQAWERDPDNRWLARAARPRLPAETIRDATLHASGLLSLTMGGPSVYPPQPVGVTEVAYGKPKWPVSDGADRYRRSLYTFRKRTAPFAMYETFDAPSGESCTARRDVSNTPLQALTLLNDGMFVEAARALGAELAAHDGDDAQRVELAFRRVLSRLPAESEQQWILEFAARQRRQIDDGQLSTEWLGGEGEGAGARALWSTVSRVILSLDEAITRN